MTHGSLFSGIGGFDLAADWMGWENVFHCEWNPFGQRVLKYHFPKSISYHDITKTDFTIHRGQIDLISGGFPCQPYSTAGKRLGKEDERHLWPEMLRAIREIQPTWVVGENVFGLVNWNGGMVFNEVQTDLEAEGYEVQPYVLPACAVNAPHRRDRVWFVAYRNGIRLEKRKDGEEMGGRQEKMGGQGGNTSNVFKADGEVSNVADTDSLRQHECECEHEVNTSERRIDALNDIEQNDFEYTTSIGLQYKMEDRKLGWKRFGESNQRNTWDSFPTQSPICTGDDGIPSRLDGITFPKWRQESIKAAGNAIVPQVVYQIFKAIEQFNDINKQ